MRYSIRRTRISFLYIILLQEKIVISKVYSFVKLFGQHMSCYRCRKYTSTSYINHYCCFQSYSGFYRSFLNSAHWCSHYTGNWRFLLFMPARFLSRLVDPSAWMRTHKIKILIMTDDYLRFFSLHAQFCWVSGQHASVNVVSFVAG